MLVWGWSAIEADFLRYYGTDALREVWSGRMTWRRMLVLITSLPTESSFAAFLRRRDFALLDVAAPFEVPA